VADRAPDTEYDSPAAIPAPATLTELEGLEGTRLGPTGWIAVDQPRVDGFAAATEDDHWMHVDPGRAAASQFGGTIVHGHLTLALGSVLIGELIDFGAFEHSLNYGYDRVRFPGTFPTGGRLRMSVEIVEARRLESGIQLRIVETFEREGAEKPVCVAELLVRFLEA
jgi:acyl dehydratase